MAISEFLTQGAHCSYPVSNDYPLVAEHAQAGLSHDEALDGLIDAVVGIVDQLAIRHLIQSLLGRWNERGRTGRVCWRRWRVVDCETGPTGRVTWWRDVTDPQVAIKRIIPFDGFRSMYMFSEQCGYFQAQFHCLHDIELDLKGQGRRQRSRRARWQHRRGMFSSCRYSRRQAKFGAALHPLLISLYQSCNPNWGIRIVFNLGLNRIHSNRVCF